MRAQHWQRREADQLRAVVRGWAGVAAESGRAAKEAARELGEWVEEEAEAVAAAAVAEAGAGAARQAQAATVIQAQFRYRRLGAFLSGKVMDSPLRLC